MKRNINLKINGMMCKHCAKRVEDALNSIKGVSKINIDEAGYELVSLEEK